VCQVCAEEIDGILFISVHRGFSSSCPVPLMLHNHSPIIHGMMYNGSIGGRGYRCVRSRCVTGSKPGTLPTSQIGIMAERRRFNVFLSVYHSASVQATLVIRDLTLRVFAITRLGKKVVRKLYSNFAVTVYGGGVTVWRVDRLVTSCQFQWERECWAS
jgi:hypothetical protein